MQMCKSARNYVMQIREREGTCCEGVRERSRKICEISARKVECWLLRALCARSVAPLPVRAVQSHVACVGERCMYVFFSPVLSLCFIQCSFFDIEKCLHGSFFTEKLNL